MEIIAMIAAIVAIITATIAPSVTAFINRRGAYKLKKLELFWDEKIKAYNEFLSAACEFPAFTKDPLRLESAANRAILFSSADTIEKINTLTLSLLDHAQSGESGNMPQANVEALAALRGEIQKYKE